MIRLATMSEDEIDLIEDKITKLLQTQPFTGYALASSFFVPGSANQAGTIVFIFQKAI